MPYGPGLYGFATKPFGLGPSGNDPYRGLFA